MNDKKNMVQVEPKTRYRAYEIDMQRMIGKFYISNTRNKEVLEIKEKDVFEVQNQIIRPDCMAFSQLLQAYPDGNQDEIRDILFVNGKDGWWNQERCHVKKEKNPMSGETILEILIINGFDLIKESKKGEENKEKKKAERIRYVKFEESASMSKKGCMTFIRKDIYDDMEKRITLGLQEPLYSKNTSKNDIVSWQNGNNGPILAKWHAYKGLTMSSGWNVNELFERLYDKGKIQKKIDLNAESVVVVPDWGEIFEIPVKGIEEKEEKEIKRKKYPDCWTNILSGNNGENEADYTIKKMSEMSEKDWKEYLKNKKKSKKTKDWINYSDGEGFISEEFGAYLEQLLRQVEKEQVTGCLSSFQIRLPFIKGMVHRVDFKKYFHENNIAKIKDRYGIMHDVDTIEMILTESMFKAFKWLNIKFGNKAEKDTGNIAKKEAWQYYWDQIKEYNHSLYISEKNATRELVDKNNKDHTYTNLNYQIIHTVGFSEAEIMKLADQSFGYKKKYEKNELENLDKLDSQQDIDDDFYEENDDGLEDNEERKIKSSHDWIQMAVKENPKFRETAWVKEELKDASNKMIKDFQKGHLLIRGTTRYLSTDLFGLMQYIGNEFGRDKEGNDITKKNKQKVLCKNQFFAPNIAGLNSSYMYGISRNPHIARNEHVMLKPLLVGTENENNKKLQHYEKYFGKLTGVLMVSPASLVAQRMGGADYDGDKVRLIESEEYNNALKERILDSTNKKMKLPLIRIEPAAVLKEKWSDQYRQREYELYRAINENRVGKFSNLAFKLGCKAYGFLGDKEYEEETLKFTIYTGLELDSVKSGVRPKVDENKYEESKAGNPFLQMKNGKSMGKISYYKTLAENMKKTKNKIEADTDQAEECIKNAFELMPLRYKDQKSAMLLLPYYVKEENKKINKGDKAEKQKNLETYIFERLYKEIKEKAKSSVLDKKDDVDANEEKTPNKKISKVKMICDAIACLQKGLSEANQYVSYINRKGGFTYENNRTYDGISKILYKQHSDEIAEEKFGILDSYVENINTAELGMSEIKKAAKGLLNKYFEFISDKNEKEKYIKEMFKEINEANGKYNLEDCNGELTDILCDFSFGGYQIAYRMLKSLKQQKEKEIREELDQLFDKDEERKKLKKIINGSEETDGEKKERIWEWVEDRVKEKNDELKEDMKNDGEWRETINIDEGAKDEVYRLMGYAVKKLPEDLEKFSKDPETYLSKMTENKFEELTGYYKGVLSQIKQTADREQKAKELLQDMIKGLEIDGNNLVLRAALEYWHRQDSKVDQRKAEHFLWQVAGEEIIKEARKLEVEHA
ncbi:hypothetical protein OCV46_13515 [Anthropogastromicrobium aceti]|uniref:hypothetical protein n=1 Tax=Anthropogastromicrobium aceti TaxID=2981768 RepID=UPI0008224CDF|nr:hypothetical protein [Anthropogastromicrobium aceti]MCU6784934.1 hypothetical protein [Anthropogastromicrobium aceti]SCJ79468.1 Uncharacterised protein [uncultured Lachnospira sp.]